MELCLQMLMAVVFGIMRTFAQILTHSFSPRSLGKLHSLNSFARLSLMHVLNAAALIFSASILFNYKIMLPLVFLSSELYSNISIEFEKPGSFLMLHDASLQIYASPDCLSIGRSGRRALRPWPSGRESVVARARAAADF
jgi:hypothetical protein